MSETSLPELGNDGCILEGIVTTLNADRSVNISPMGPIVDPQLCQLILRPFKTSTTYKNLKRTGQGIFHVTDDVQLFAQAALGTPDPMPTLIPSESVEGLTIDGMVLADSCRWYAFEVSSLDDRDERTHIVAKTVSQARNRDFLGFNRAKHAVIETAILATRLHLLPEDQVRQDLQHLATQVAKTASKNEQQAFDFLCQHIERTLSELAVTKSEPENLP
ncbi:MAG: DUF447 family protein [Planctomycetes bacterium]|nr:DUF447 family protein [Planctomycetota bacterium]